jgi:hypothetical protein
MVFSFASNGLRLDTFITLFPDTSKSNSVANALNLQALADVAHRLGASGDGGEAASIALAAESKNCRPA